jgi:hypothetical protein
MVGLRHNLCQPLAVFGVCPAPQDAPDAQDRHGRACAGLIPVAESPSHEQSRSWWISSLRDVTKTFRRNVRHPAHGSGRCAALEVLSDPGSRLVELGSWAGHS